MKAGIALRLGVAIVGVSMCGSVLAQGPGGMGPGAGFGEHKPPFEKAMGPKGEHGRWWNNPRMVEQLKLTDEQRKAMDQTLFEHRERLIDLRASVEKAELEMQPLMKDDQPNEGKILAQIDKIAAARAELEKANARFLLAIRGKLTPEQWKQVQAFRANRDQERGAWGEGGQGRGEMGPGRQLHQFHRQLPPPSPPVAPGAGPQGMLEEGDGAAGPEAPEPGAVQ